MSPRSAVVALLGLVVVGGCGGHSTLKAGSGGTGGFLLGSGGTVSATGGAATETGGATTAAGGTTMAAGGAAGAAGDARGTGGDSCGPKCSTVTTCPPSVIAGGLTLLTDFSSNLDAGHMFHTGGLTDWTSLFGGTWISPSASDLCAAIPAPYPLTESFSAGNWHITGTVASSRWAGAGIWFGTSCPVQDFSAYQGFSFTIAGNAGPSASVTVTVGTAANTAPNTDTTSANFTCYANAATCAAATCSPASLIVRNISDEPQTVRVLWADLANGVPVATPDAKQITALGFNPTLDWSGTASPYALDLIIDDLALIP